MPARKKTNPNPPKAAAKRPPLKALPAVTPDEPVPGVSDEFSAAFNRAHRRDDEILEALRKA